MRKVMPGDWASGFQMMQGWELALKKGFQIYQESWWQQGGFLKPSGHRSRCLVVSRFASLSV